MFVLLYLDSVTGTVQHLQKSFLFEGEMSESFSGLCVSIKPGRRRKRLTWLRDVEWMQFKRSKFTLNSSKSLFHWTLNSKRR